jgi:hypothetical protein
MTKGNGNGWILLHRKIIETSFYKNPRAVLLAIHLLLKACHREQTVNVSGWQEVVLRRGQYLGGYKRLGLELSWAKTQTRRAIKILEDEGFLERQVTNKYCIITILNYNGYQGKQKYPEGVKIDTQDVVGGVRNDTQGGTKRILQGAQPIPHTINNKQYKQLYIEHFEEVWSS